VDRRACGARLGVLGEAREQRRRPPGGREAGKRRTGCAARCSNGRAAAYLLLELEPEYDMADPAATLRGAGAGRDRDRVFAVRNGALEYADAILPIAPFTETAGTFVNARAGCRASTASSPLGEARPGWKVLRVLGNLLELPGFDFRTRPRRCAPKRWATPEFAARLSNDTRWRCRWRRPAEAGLERLADVPIYFSRPIVRRAPRCRPLRTRGRRGRA
jgi:NADH-quinone oxidoreductase subunit G